MARNAGYDKAYQRFEQQFSEYVNSNLEKQARTIVEQTADAFCEASKNRLLKYTYPANNTSLNNINALAESIHYDMTENGKANVIIPDDYNGLALFLEYGTGYTGLKNPHPEANFINWHYDTNKHGVKPFYFRAENASYISQFDSYPNISTKYYIDKYGNAKTYQYTQENWVKSWGIKPVKYIYKTKMEFTYLLRRRYNSKGYRRELEIIKSGGLL